MAARIDSRRPRRPNRKSSANFIRRPSPVSRAPEELQVAERYLSEPRLDAAGGPLDAQNAKRQGYEDLLWALINTKEFLYNH